MVANDELGALPDIERDAGQCFRDVGMPAIAEDEPLPVEVLAAYQRAARAWAAVDGGDEPMAFDGAPALTLTTFAEVPWNAPYYRRCGFRVVGGNELTPGLRAIRAREDTHGLDRWPRVCMRRDL